METWCTPTTSCTTSTLLSVGASRKYVELDHRRRVAIGRYARHDLYLLTVSAEGIITLTPAELMPLPTPPPVRKRVPRPRKKAAPAAAEKLQED